MTAITQQSFGGGSNLGGFIDKDDQRVIVFKDPCKVMGRKAGDPYTVDSALAFHYVETLSVAEYAKDDPGPTKAQKAAAKVRDRSMRGPREKSGANDEGPAGDSGK